MIQSKKELINQYNEGILKDNAVYNPSAFDAFVLVEWDDENVFGYYQYERNEKQFFKVKMNPLNEDYYFLPLGHYLKSSQFLRI